MPDHKISSPPTADVVAGRTEAIQIDHYIDFIHGNSQTKKCLKIINNSFKCLHPIKASLSPLMRSPHVPLNMFTL